jgi:hypothetical protein
MGAKKPPLGGFFMGCLVRRDMLHMEWRQSDWSETVPPHTRYDRVATSYSQYRPRYPDVLVANLAGIIEAANGTGLVLENSTARPGARAPGGARAVARSGGTAPHRRDHVAFGYRFACLTVRRNP